MGFLALCVLAVVQGLTEFLPVSSSGHLVLSRELLGLEIEDALTVDITLHLGTLIAVIAVYRKDVWELVTAVLSWPKRRLARLEPSQEDQLLARLVVGTLPAAVVGVLFKDDIEARLMNPLVVGIALAFTAVVLFVADRLSRVRSEERGGVPSYAIALAIGCAQAVALCPGCSRSGWTIAAGLCLGLGAAQAARFSFLLALPAVGGAALLQAKEILDGAGSSNVAPLELLGGLIVSALTGYLACRLLLLVLRAGALRWFAAYCLVAGLIAVGSSLG